MTIKSILTHIMSRNKKHNNDIYRQQLYDSSSPPPRYVRLADGGGDDTCSSSTSYKGRGSSNGKGSSPTCRKGYVPVMVVGAGQEDVNVEEKFLIPIELMDHPFIVSLLEKSAQEFGFEQEGAIQIPCDLDHFRDTINSLNLPLKKR